MKTLLKQHTITIITLLSTLLFLLFPSKTSSQNCQRFCGKIPFKYPFGSGSGCGDPRFQNYLTCKNDNQTLTFNTHTGSYPITSIDYSNQVIYISDPDMSTCSCDNNNINNYYQSPSHGHGFGLDWDAPFSFHGDSIFALLDCSLEDSPIYTPKRLSSTIVPLCDKQGLAICAYLYSCPAINTNGNNYVKNDNKISSCCVYAPGDLGPAFDVDLEELKCGSYSGFYGFNGRKFEPKSWSFGVALRYKLGVYNEFPSHCGECEKSFGACGYSVGAYTSFLCNCPSGLNSTSDCFFGFTSFGSSLLFWESTGWVMLVYYMALLFWFF